MLRNSWKVLAIIAVAGINLHFIPSARRLLQNAEARAYSAVHRNSHAACSMRKSVYLRNAQDEDFSTPAASLATLASWPQQPSGAQQPSPMPEEPVINLQGIQEQVEGAMAKVHELDDDDAGWIGVAADEVTADRARDAKLSPERGVYISSVQTGSPADKAGLKKGDVIISYNGQELQGARQFRRMVRETPPGRTVNLSVWRDGGSHPFSVKIGSHEDSGREESFVFPGMEDHGSLPRNFKFHLNMPTVWDFGGPRLGINAQDLNGQLGSYFGAPDGKGVLVTEVLPGTPAEKAGLKAGDVIVRVEGKSIDSTSDLRQGLRAKAGAGGDVSLSVLRRGSAITINVKLPKPPAPDSDEVIQRVQL